MPTYVLLTKVSPEVKKKVAQHCPRVKWLASYALLGPYDYLDVVEAPDNLTPSKLAAVVRSFGHATTETWSAIPWAQFKHTLAELP